MLRLTAERRGNLGREPGATAASEPHGNIGVRDCRLETSVCRVSGSRPRDLLVTVAGLAVFLGVIALTGLVATVLYGPGGLALGVGVFVVTLMVVARKEGLI